jgi:Rab family protein
MHDFSTGAPISGSELLMASQAGPYGHLRVKIVVMGMVSVGKTSIISSYLSGSFDRDVRTTPHLAWFKKEEVIDDQPLILQICDTPGDDRFVPVGPAFYRDAQGAIIVYDVTNSESYNSVDYWMRELKVNVEEGIIILVCANKIDLEDQRVVDFLHASSSAIERGALYAETSAVSGVGVEKMFQLALTTLMKQRLVDAGRGRGPVGLRGIGDGGTEKKPCCR